MVYRARRTVLTHPFLILILLSLPWTGKAQDRITGKSFATRSEVIAQHGIAATSHPLATQIALDILKQGGNAIDAAIAANAALGLMEPTGCGVGGDLFALVWHEESGRLYGLNASGPSPRSLPLSYFSENGHLKIPNRGPLPVSVPGCVDGWFELHARFGHLAMQEILAPAITYAREGFPVTELIAYYMKKGAEILAQYPGFAQVFMPGGRTPRKGELFKNPDLARTYARLASSGRDAFYRGEIAHIIAAYIKKHGGFLTYEDLSTFKSEWVDPVSVDYRGYQLYELPPNGQGIAALQMLNILEGFDIRAMGFGSTAYLHHFIEAKKLAFEDRARYYADPVFADIPVDTLLSEQYAERRRSLISPDKAARSYDPGEIDHGETIYLTVADKDGNMVSLIQSNYSGMGSGMTPEGLGFVLQNRGALFSLEPGHPNVYAPGKRPFHTIIPAFLFKDGKPWISFGLMGGAMQPQGHAQIVINLVDFDMSLQEAGDAPRIRHTGSSQPTGEKMTSGGIVNVESGFSYEGIRDLMHLGHDVRFDIGVYGGYQAIMRNDELGVYFAASESRKDGQAAGY